MLKCIMLTLTFAVAFGAVGFSLTNQADAQWRRGGPYVSYYFGTPAYNYGSYSPSRYVSYYAPQSYYYAPQGYYYTPQPYYYGSYYNSSPVYYRPVPRVVLRDGWWR
jgi:hypothetical protein